MHHYQQVYINGQWIDSAGAESIEVINASTEAVLARVPAGTPVDVDRAVAAAGAIVAITQTDIKRPKFKRADSE